MLAEGRSNNAYKNQYEELGDQLDGSKVESRTGNVQPPPANRCKPGNYLQRERDLRTQKKRTDEAEIALTVYQKTKELKIENMRHAFSALPAIPAFPS